MVVDIKILSIVSLRRLHLNIASTYSSHHLDVFGNGDIGQHSFGGKDASRHSYFVSILGVETQVKPHYSRCYAHWLATIERARRIL